MRELDFDEAEAIGLDGTLRDGHAPWTSADIPFGKRGTDVPGCFECEDPHDMRPPHFASARCESGQYAHCTCDTCF